MPSSNTSLFRFPQLIATTKRKMTRMILAKTLTTVTRIATRRMTTKTKMMMGRIGMSWRKRPKTMITSECYCMFLNDCKVQAFLGSLSYGCITTPFLSTIRRKRVEEDDDEDDRARRTSKGKSGASSSGGKQPSSKHHSSAELKKVRR